MTEDIAKKKRSPATQEDSHNDSQGFEGLSLRLSGHSSRVLVLEGGALDAASLSLGHQEDLEVDAEHDESR